MTSAHSFHEMVKHLPDRLSKQMAENLSVPIAFVCLLHLANEKVCIVILAFIAGLLRISCFILGHNKT